MTPPSRSPRYPPYFFFLIHTHPSPFVFRSQRSDECRSSFSYSPHPLFPLLLHSPPLFLRPDAKKKITKKTSCTPLWHRAAVSDKAPAGSLCRAPTPLNAYLIIIPPSQVSELMPACQYWTGGAPQTRIPDDKLSPGFLLRSDVTDSTLTRKHRPSP